MMDIGKLARDRTVEGIARNIGVTGTDIDDLSQMVYEILLEKPPEKLDIPDEEINYYLTRIIKNQWHSKTSTFYRTYKRYYALLDGNGIHPDENDDEEDD